MLLLHHTKFTPQLTHRLMQSANTMLIWKKFSNVSATVIFRQFIKFSQVSVIVNFTQSFQTVIFIETKIFLFLEIA
jgi:hypothetical protein